MRTWFIIATTMEERATGRVAKKCLRSLIFKYFELSNEKQMFMTY